MRRVDACATSGRGPFGFSPSADRVPIAMIAVPIAADPNVTTNPNSNSPSAVPGDELAKIKSRK